MKLSIMFSLFLWCIFMAGCTYLSSAEQDRIHLVLDGKDYLLLTARTPAERTKGLSGIRELKGADGMIFYFDPPQRTSFWNRDTHLDLELIWYRNSRIIGRDFLPSEDRAGFVRVESPSEVDAVIELVQ